MSGREQQGSMAEAGETRDAPGLLPAKAVEWGFRLLAGREPLNAAEFAAFQALPDLEAMRRAFVNMPELHAFFDALVTDHQSWGVPLFLLRQPSSPALDWRFEPPTLERPICQLCTAAQYNEPVYAEIVEAMGQRGSHGRWLWEQAWIISHLATAGLIAPDKRGLAIQAGRERVAAVLAARGTEVVGTHEQARGPAALEQRRVQLFHPEIMPIEDFDTHVLYAELDPRRIGQAPEAAFDACWSIGLPHQLGSVEAALRVLQDSLVPLKPGGLALHVVDLNLTSNETTWELPDLVLLRLRDIEDLAERLRAQGHAMLPVTTHPGWDPADERVKSDPGGKPGHRQRHGTTVATSFGIAIRKAGRT